MNDAAPQVGSIGIVGGSLGGLFHAVALTSVGIDVDVFERSTGRPDDRGAGIVLQPTVDWILRQLCGVDAAAASVAVTHRQFLDHDGHSGLVASPQHMISWGAIYQALRGAFDDRRYHAGHAVTNVGDDPTYPAIDGRTFDLVVLADGIASHHRHVVSPQATSSYAGYVAYRGVIAEPDLPVDLTTLLHHRLTFFNGPDTQFLCYFIPGEDGATEPGQRRLNWVWYVPTSHDGLADITTGVDGVQRATSVPAGLMRDDTRNRLERLARTSLPSPCRRLVEHTADPFAQAILDQAVSAMRSRRILLTGDAAFVIRPHTAASTEKAAADAVTLVDTLRRQPDLDQAIGTWERIRLLDGQRLHDHGIRLGRRFSTTSTAAHTLHL